MKSEIFENGHYWKLEFGFMYKKKPGSNWVAINPYQMTEIELKIFIQLGGK